MTQDQVQQLLDQRKMQDTQADLQLVETHISWLLLGSEYVFKIKKPVRYSFLDFSTLEERKFYCQEEVRLNRRLSPDMYLGVVPIRKTGTRFSIGEGKGQIVDYAVLMRRMDESRQMDILLRNNEVNHHQIQQLAEQLAAFHTSARRVKTPLDLPQMEEDFAGVLEVRSFIESQLGVQAGRQLEKMVNMASQFLQDHAFQLYVRRMQGWIIDGHGDLHSRNIFLLEEPVVFDCIEFGDHFREVDVLDELAFFCMDLNFHGRMDLEKQFLMAYLRLNPCMNIEVDQQLFVFYKLYRANVRLKVEALRAIQQSHITQAGLKRLQRYFELMQSYQAQLASAVTTS